MLDVDDSIVGVDVLACTTTVLLAFNFAANAAAYPLQSVLYKGLLAQGSAVYIILDQKLPTVEPVPIDDPFNLKVPNAV